MTPIKTPAGYILPLRLPKGSKNINIVSLKDPFTFEDTCSQLQYGFPIPTLIGLPEGNWQILGQISHKGEFGFDPEPYVESRKYVSYPDGVGGGWFEDMSFMDYKYDCFDQSEATDSFISLIESQGEILWGNPMGERPTADKFGWYSKSGFDDDESGWMIEGDEDAFSEAFTKWLYYESKLVKENELILNLINR